MHGKFTALSLLDRYDQIAGLLTEFGRVRRESPVLHLMRGQTAYAQSQYGDALEEFQKVLTLHKSHIDALVGQVATLRALGRFSESRAALTVALRRFPDDSRLRTEEGWLRFDQGDFDGALACFKRTDATENTFRGMSAVHRRRGEYGKARDLIEDALANLPDSPSLLTERGWIIFDGGQYVESRKSFEGVLNISAEHREARQGQVASLVRLHKYEQAHHLLAAAIRQHPKSPVFHVEEGHLRSNKAGSVRPGLRFQARKVSPRDANAVIGESMALRSMKEYEEALRMLDEELARYDETPALRSERGWVLLEKAKRSPRSLNSTRPSFAPNE